MPLPSIQRRCRSWWAGILLLAFCVGLSLVRADRYPVSIDVYYHMAAIEGFRQAGGVSLWAFWEHALPGRPHLYPPVLHAGGLLASWTGVSPWRFAAFLSWALWPLSLWLAWGFMLRLRGPAAALLTVAFLAGSNAWLFQQNAHTANALGLCLALASLWASVGRKSRAAGVLGLLAAGAHGAGLVAPLALGLARSLGGGRRFQALAWETGLPLLGLAPWWWHMAAHRSAVQPREGVAQLASFRLDFLLWAIAFLGAGACMRAFWRVRRNSHPETARLQLLPLAFLAAFAVLFFFSYGHRFWAYNIFLPLSLLAGFGGHAMLRRLPKGRARSVGFTALAIAALSCWCWWGARPGALPQGGNTRGAARTTLTWRASPPAFLGILKPRSPQYAVLAEWLRPLEELGPGDVVSAAGVAGSLVTAVTGAWSTGGLLGEVRGPTAPTAPLQCDYLIDVPPWFELGRGAPMRYRVRPVHPAFEAVPIEGPPWNPARKVQAIGGAFEPRLLKRKDALDGPRSIPAADVPRGAVALGAAGLLLVALSDRVRRHQKTMTAGALALAAIPWVTLLVAVLR